MKQQTEYKNPQDPDHWKWGVFYFDPKDVRLFVPKKNPAFGVTINFADPRSYLLLVSLLFLIVFYSLKK